MKYIQTSFNTRQKLPQKCCKFAKKITTGSKYLLLLFKISPKPEIFHPNLIFVFPCIIIILQLKELKERQKQQLRHKAMKKGLDPE